MNRIWKTIEDNEDYEVSNDGLVRKKENKKVLAQTAQKSDASEGYVRYIVTLKNNKKHRVHRLVANAFVPNPENKLEVDHIDGNALNNHYTNLRWATRHEQMRNTKKPVNNTSGTKGVSWKKDKVKWKAYCSLNGKQYHFGYFDNIEDAKKAVIKGRSELHGEFGKHE
jgi:hypothetical protein